MAIQKMPPYPIFEPQVAPPREMDAWQMRLDLPQVNENYGTFEVVHIGKSSIEQHHLVDVLDEENKPLYGVYVVFGYPGQTTPDLSYLKPRANYGWVGAPAVLAGNAQFTDFSGHVQHTTGASGGEDIWVWYVVPNPLRGNQLELYLSSTIVRNCKVIADINSHTGVHIVFRRNMNLENQIALPE